MLCGYHSIEIASVEGCFHSTGDGHKSGEQLINRYFGWVFTLISSMFYSGNNSQLKQTPIDHSNIFARTMQIQTIKSDS